MPLRNLFGFFLFAALTVSVIAGCDSSRAKPVPAIVEGDSMAPTVFGDHLAVKCSDCQYEFTSELIAKEDFAVTCPNCGFDELKVSQCETVATQQVELQPFAKFPRRWDIVGFNLPEDSEKPTGVKRIVGLPGETIEIIAGDLRSNDKVLRKSWKLQKEVRVPVFDSKFDATAPFDNSKRLSVARGDSGWKVRGSELFFIAGSSDIDWLDYVQWRNFRRPGARDDVFPIEDAYGFNQQTARELNATDDLMIQLDAEFDADSIMNLVFRRDEAEFHFQIQKKETEFVFQWNGTTQRKPLVYQSRLIDQELPGGVIEFSSFDRSLMLRINGTAVFELRENESATEQSVASTFGESPDSVFRIGGSRGAIRIERTRVWRDIYYLAAPAGYASSKNAKLTAGDAEYILLGDNSPKSLDSRMWKTPGIKRSDLIGRLIVEDPSQ